MREHFDRLAAEDNRRDTSTPVRGHHDQVAPSRRGGIDNCLIDLFMLDVKRVAGDTYCLGCIRNDAKYFVGLSLRMLLVFNWGVFELARGNREQMERLSDRNSGNLGTDLFGEKDTLLDGLGREIRPIVAIRMFLNNVGLLRSPPVSASF